MQQIHKKLLTTLLDTVYPPACIKCSAPTDIPNSLCSNCWNKIHWLSDPCCDICHFPFEYHIEDRQHCASCIAHPPVYDKARSVFLYDTHSRELVTRYKYGDRTHHAKTYGKWMAQTGASLLDESDMLCPVPLHWKRLLLRKYNQSSLLAHHIGQFSRIEVQHQLLLKSKNSVPQASLSKKQRLKNTKGVFKINPKYKNMIENKTITIIDDVTTTSATINECAAVLKKHGAKKVYVLTLAKTLEGEA